MRVFTNSCVEPLFHGHSSPLQEFEKLLSQMLANGVFHVVIAEFFPNAFGNLIP
jgi:hypothetical protein